MYEEDLEINVLEILPDSLPSGKKLHCKRLGDDFLEIYADKHSSRGGPPLPVRIRQYITVDESSAELFGLWFGDGIRIQWGVKNVFGFSNTELSLHKLFLDCSKKYLGIPSESYHCVLQLPEHLKGHEKELEHMVSKELSIPLKNFWKSRINPTRNMVGVDVKINSRLLGVLMHLVLNKFEELSQDDTFLAAGMLRGIIASEGNVHVRKSGRLGEISVAGKEQLKRDFIRSLFLKVGVLPNKDKTIEHQESVLVHGISNFKLVKSFGLASLHPHKRLEFERGMKGFKIEQSRKGELRFLVLEQLSKGTKTRQQLAKTLGRSPATIKTEALYILETKGLVERDVIENKCRLWKITKKGSDFLRYGKIEDLRSRR